MATLNQELSPETILYHKLEALAHDSSEVIGDIWDDTIATSNNKDAPQEFIDKLELMARLIHTTANKAKEIIEEATAPSTVIQTDTEQGLSTICQEAHCPYRKECANHESAGDYRSEDGFSPELSIKDNVILCRTKNRPEHGLYADMPININNLWHGFATFRKGQLAYYDEE